jgi:nitrile hydratase
MKLDPNGVLRSSQRAWVDPQFKARPLENGAAAVRELGFEGTIFVVENTADTHNIVVCTLCSCYPIWLLGIPPNWYKMAAYRARAVCDPRGVLDEFGVGLTDDIQVRVWDSTAELRYLVLPQRPEGTQDWDESRLARLVSRNSMKVLALASTLSEAGHFTPVDWSDALGAELRRANERGAPDDQTTYYAAALAALEHLIVANGSVTTGGLSERVEEWRSTYMNTPHGQPVELIGGTKR